MAVSVPFSRQDELFISGACQTVPGHPNLDLADTASVSRFLVAELSTKRLATMYKILFLTSKPRNISPLHHQAIRGRRIVITERPELHLITCPGQILVKPLPRWLMSYSFSATHIFHPNTQTAGLAEEAQGFLRTYASLIQHESDLEIARAEKLVPPGVEWGAWCRFIHQLKYPFMTSSEYVETGCRKTSNFGQHLPMQTVPAYADSLVSPRYHYGEIGLVRLNMWCFLTFREWEYLPVLGPTAQVTDCLPRFAFFFVFWGSEDFMAAFIRRVSWSADILSICIVCPSRLSAVFPTNISFA